MIKSRHEAKSVLAFTNTACRTQKIKRVWYYYLYQKKFPYRTINIRRKFLDKNADNNPQIAIQFRKKQPTRRHQNSHDDIYLDQEINTKFSAHAVHDSMLSNLNLTLISGFFQVTNAL